MKNNVILLFIILLSMSGLPGVNGQQFSSMTINGYVVDEANGNGLWNQKVFFKLDLTQPLVTVYDTTVTSWNGYFSNTLQIPQTGDMMLEVYVYDCDTVKHSYFFNHFDPHEFRVFQICPPLYNCGPDFYYFTDSLNLLKHYFFDVSTGNINSWYWDFGDGSVSLEENPIHTYLGPGIYEVKMIVADTFGSYQCIDSLKATVIIDPANFCNLGGQVFNGQFPILSGDVILYLSTNSGYIALDTAKLNSNGAYYFYQLQHGKYLVRAMPDPEVPSQANLMPTYMGDMLFWTQAQMLNMNSNYFQADVQLQSCGHNTGPGSISGTLLLNSMGTTFAGQGEHVLLFDTDWNALDYFTTTDSGIYFFNNLPLQSYYLYPELTGIYTQPILITLSASSPSIENMNIYVNMNSGIGIEEPKLDASASLIYPNPVNDKAMMTVTVDHSSAALLQLQDLSGRTLYTGSYLLESGSNILSIPCETLTSGCYFCTLHLNEYEIITRKMIK